MGREPDEVGRNFWLDKLDHGEFNRKDLLEQFLASKEFKDICDKYSIS